MVTFGLRSRCFFKELVDGDCKEISQELFDDLFRKIYSEIQADD